ncbi:MAG: hypothetical protein KAW12_03810 [Candidatus Aminicenantes bacterium]|nr:hypothetical protein [Candidatus Aminicenantes bacterium]
MERNHAGVDVELVHPQVWGALVDEVLEKLPEKMCAAVCAVISTMHNRHVGITPGLAAEFVLLMEDPQAARRRQGPWQKVIERLKNEALPDRGQAEKTASEQWSYFAVLPGTVPPYSIMRLCLPIVEEACRRLGKCYLFYQEEAIDDDEFPAGTASNPQSGKQTKRLKKTKQTPLRGGAFRGAGTAGANRLGAPHPRRRQENTISLEEYRDYSVALAAEIENTAADNSDSRKISWKERALTLSGYSLRPGLWRTAGQGLPETDPAAAALLLRLQPDIDPGRRRLPTVRPLSARLEHREVPRSREGGIGGIRITRRPEDIEDILMSEFIHPREILLDRMINSGYLALKRQPKREKLRDVLLVGLMPAAVQPGLSADFIKACWFDFIARFGHTLQRSRLFRSEFRWLEGDAFGRISSSRFLLQDLHLQDRQQPTDSPANALYRHRFLVALGWLPHYLDTRRSFEALPGPPPTTVKKWAFAAWKAQEDNPNWALYEAQRHIFSASPVRHLEVKEFAFVHLMLFLPARRGQRDRLSYAAEIGRLYSGFGLGAANTPGRGISITRVPEEVAASRQWTFEARGIREPLLFPRPEPRFTGGKIAGRLEGAWRQQLVKEIWHA